MLFVLPPTPPILIRLIDESPSRVPQVDYLKQGIKSLLDSKPWANPGPAHEGGRGRGARPCVTFVTFHHVARSATTTPPPPMRGALPLLFPPLRTPTPRRFASTV